MMAKVIYIIILLMLWAFFAASETAFISVSRFKLNNLKKKGKKRASLAYYLLERPERLLATSLVGINISLVLSANITALLFFNIFGRPKPIISIAVLTFVSLIFCEIIPKNLAIKKSLNVTILTSIPMYIFYIAFFPIGKIFAFLSKALIRLINISHTGLILNLFKRKEDVEIFLKASLQKRLTEDERKYFVDSLDFGKKVLSDIMTPLVEIHALPQTEKIKECHSFISKYRNSYIPVYNKRIDNIIGVIYVQDLFNVNKNLPLSHMIREPLFIPETKNINELYRELYEKDIPIVFAVDEYGGITGMSTIYDIGEEVIGKISGFEDKKSLIVRLKEGEYLCDGEVEIDEISDILSIDIDSNAFITLNGLISSKIGRVPKKGDYIVTNGYRFSVEEGSNRKAELIRISTFKG